MREIKGLLNESKEIEESRVCLMRTRRLKRRGIKSLLNENKEIDKETNQGFA